MLDANAKRASYEDDGEDGNEPDWDALEAEERASVARRDPQLPAWLPWSSTVDGG